MSFSFPNWRRRGSEHFLVHDVSLVDLRERLVRHTKLLVPEALGILLFAMILRQSTRNF